MNDFLTNIQAIVGLALMIFNIIFVLRMKAFFIAEKEELIERGKKFYAAEKKDIVEGLPIVVGQLFSKAQMSNLGRLSGVSRQLKGLEKDLIAEGVDSQMPGLGTIAAKYIQKYPILMQLLPVLAQKMNNPRGSQSGELGKIG